jgi:hypothetical protein
MCVLHSAIDLVFLLIFALCCNLYFAAAVTVAEVVDVEEAAVAATEAEGKIVCPTH